MKNFLRLNVLRNLINVLKIRFFFSKFSSMAGKIFFVNNKLALFGKLSFFGWAKGTVY